MKERSCLSVNLLLTHVIFWHLRLKNEGDRNKPICCNQSCMHRTITNNDLLCLQKVFGTCDTPDTYLANFKLKGLYNVVKSSIDDWMIWVWWIWKGCSFKVLRTPFCILLGKKVTSSFYQMGWEERAGVQPVSACRRGRRQHSKSSHTQLSASSSSAALLFNSTTATFAVVLEKHSHYYSFAKCFEHSQ